MTTGITTDDRPTLELIALKVERAVGALPPDAIMHTDSGKPMESVSGKHTSVRADGFVTARDLHELATAVLYLKLVRKGKEGSDAAA